MYTYIYIHIYIHIYIWPIHFNGKFIDGEISWGSASESLWTGPFVFQIAPCLMLKSTVSVQSFVVQSMCKSN